LPVLGLPGLKAMGKRWATCRCLSINSQSTRPFDELTVHPCGFFSKKRAWQDHVQNIAETEMVSVFFATSVSSDYASG
jgi:hypothetical protein